KGTSMDGKGQFEYIANPEPLSGEVTLPPGEPRLYGTDMVNLATAPNGAAKTNGSTLKTGISAK
nr:manganese catalase family protein [Oculatellaceae cyanobacterium Prado106]